MTLRFAALHPFAGLIHRAALTPSLPRTALFLGQLKIPRLTFIMTGADKYAGRNASSVIVVLGNLF